MDKFIKAEAFKRKLIDEKSFFPAIVARALEETPAADVVEVKHGKWLPDYETFVDEWERESEPIQTGWVCSLCGRQEFIREPYCHCGAKMDAVK